eukprot:5937754-Amphidinium_carterae.1
MGQLFSACVHSFVQGPVVLTGLPISESSCDCMMHDAIAFLLGAAGSGTEAVPALGTTMMSDESHWKVHRIKN